LGYVVRWVGDGREWPQRIRGRVLLGGCVQRSGPAIWRVVGMGWEGDRFVLNVVMCEGGKP
jgi:hypothetical protein